MKNLRALIVGVCICTFGGIFNATAQTVGISGSVFTPDADAILELQATDKGFLLPRMTAAERTTYTSAANSGGGLGAAEEGMTIYNSTTKEYNVWDGTQWIMIGGTTSGAGFIENQIAAAQSAADFWIDGKGVTTTLGIGTTAALSSRVHIHDASVTGGESLLLIDDFASSPVLQVQDIGRVGIGTAAPISTLDVVGKGTVQFGGDVVVLDPGYVAGASLALGTLATPDTYLRFGNSGGTLNYLDTKGHDFHIYSTATTPGLYFQESNGFVGIGTASPLDEMHVEGSIRMVDGNEAAGRVPVSDANGTMTWTDPSAIDDGDWTLVGFDIERQSGDVYIGNTNATNNDLYISDRLIDWDNTTRYLDPSGTSQINRIHYEVGSAATPPISFRVDANSGIYQPAAGQIGWTINGTEGMRLNASRNLGIGSTNPTDGKVHINQTTTADALYITHTSGSSTGQVVNINKTANPVSANDILQITVPAGAPDDFQFVEFDRGGSVEFAVDGDGDVDFDGALEPSGDPGTVGQILRSGGLNASPTWVDASTIGSDITTASNGLTEVADDIQLGGTLTQNTTVTQGAFNMSFDLNSTGDFRIMDGGTTRARFEDGGRVEILGTTDANGTAGSGVLEIGNALRLDNNEIITNTNAILYINNDNGGDVSMDGSTFRMDASANRVGIGDTAPTAKLEIGDADGQSLMLSRQDGTVSANEQLGGIGFDGSDGNTPSDIRESSASIIAFASEAHSSTDKGGHLTFWTSPTDQDDNTDGFERMRIEESGEVGIGTTTPAAKLQIDQNAATVALNVRNVTNTSTGQVVNIERTQFPTAGNDMIQITVPAGSSNDFQFVEFDRGGSVEFAVDGDGDVDFDGALEPNGLPGTAGQLLRSGGTNASPTWVDASTLSGALDQNLSEVLTVGNSAGGNGINMNNNNITNVNYVQTRAESDYDKLRVYSSSNYTIGMHSGMTLGGLNDWAMTFTMNNESDRGFVWRDVSDAVSDGAMALTTAGHLTVKGRVDIGTSNTSGSDLYLADRMVDWDNTGYYVDPGGINRLNEVMADDGSVSDVSFHFAGDDNTGLYQPADNEIGMSINGTEAVRIDASREVGIGTTTPSERLDVNGNVRIRGGAPAVGDVLTATNTNGTADWQPANNGVTFVPFHSDAAGTDFWTHPDVNVRVSFNNATEQVTFHNNSGGYWDAHIRGDNGSGASAPTAISNDVANGGTLVLDLGSTNDGGFTITAGDECCGTVQGFTMQIAYWSDNLSGLISYW